MKKLALIMLVLAMVFSLVACGDDKSSDDKDDADTKTTTIAGDDTTTTADDSTDNKDDNADNTEFGDYLIDTYKCSIKVTDIFIDDFWGLTLEVELTNKSADRDYIFSVSNGSINGIMCGALLYSEVAAGDTVVEEIILYSDVIDENYTGDYTDIELLIEVDDADDISADDIVFEVVHIYPYGKDKAVKYERQPESTDIVLVDNDDFTITVIGDGIDFLDCYNVYFYIENKTDKRISILADDVYVDGVEDDPIFSASLFGDRVAFADMYSLSEGITDAEEIKFEITIYDEFSWDILYSGTLEFSL